MKTELSTFRLISFEFGPLRCNNVEFSEDESAEQANAILRLPARQRDQSVSISDFYFERLALATLVSCGWLLSLNYTIQKTGFENTSLKIVIQNCANKLGEFFGIPTVCELKRLSEDSKQPLQSSLSALAELRPFFLKLLNIEITRSLSSFPLFPVPTRITWKVPFTNVKIFLLPVAKATSAN